jgi:hypothetical protein
MFLNIIRWILLPFACILAWFLAGIIVNFFIGREGQTIFAGRYTYTVGFFEVYWYGLVKNALMSVALVYAAFFVAPIYKIKTAKIIAIVMMIVYLGLFIYGISNLNLGFWSFLAFAGEIIAFCAGLFAYKKFNEY